MFGEKFRHHLGENNEEEKEQLKIERRALFDEESKKEMTDTDMMDFLNSLEFWFIDFKLDNDDGDIGNIRGVSCNKLAKDKEGKVIIKELKYDEIITYLPEGLFRRYKKENGDSFWYWKSGGKVNEGGEESLLNGITREIPTNCLARESWLVGVFDKRSTKSQRDALKKSVENSIFQKQKSGGEITTSKGSFVTQIRKEWQKEKAEKQEEPGEIKELSAEEFDNFPERGNNSDDETFL